VCSFANVIKESAHLLERTVEGGDGGNQVYSSNGLS
jgi:hypothetical protein